MGLGKVWVRTSLKRGDAGESTQGEAQTPRERPRPSKGGVFLCLYCLNQIAQTNLVRIDSLEIGLSPQLMNFI
jgi:hypothetical protein